MNKKTYITPSSRTVNVLFVTHLMAGSGKENYTLFRHSDSRESNGGWDDDDEEEDTGGWFK